MIDRVDGVFTLNAIVEIENLVRPLEVREWEKVLNLCASHRVLHKRHRLLLREVKELEEEVEELEKSVDHWKKRFDEAKEGSV